MGGIKMFKPKTLKNRVKKLRQVDATLKKYLNREEIAVLNYFSSLNIDVYREKIDIFYKHVARDMAGQPVNIYVAKEKLFTYFDEELETPLKYEIKTLIKEIKEKLKKYLYNSQEILGYDTVFNQKLYVQAKEIFGYMNGIVKIINDDKYYYNYPHQLYQKSIDLKHSKSIEIIDYHRSKVDDATLLEWDFYKKIMAFALMLKNRLEKLSVENKKQTRYIKTAITKIRNFFKFLLGLFIEI